MKYFAEAARIWKTLVPPQGQAATVQGELLRAVEKLRDEATRNGNVNWDDGFERLVAHLAARLGASGGFDDGAVREIRHDLALVGDPESPAGDGPFDRLADRVVEWCLRQDAPVPHAPDPLLRR